MERNPLCTNLVKPSLKFKLASVERQIKIIANTTTPLSNPKTKPNTRLENDRPAMVIILFTKSEKSLIRKCKSKKRIRNKKMFIVSLARVGPTI